jgi:hypothetical protein
MIGDNSSCQSGYPKSLSSRAESGKRAKKALLRMFFRGGGPGKRKPAA